MSPQDALILFKQDLSRLSENERQVLELLVQAGKLITPIYALQENHRYPGANFYPHDAIKEEIEKEGKKNPQVLSPYTVVERVNGKMLTIPYHRKYAHLLKPVANKLNEATQICDDKEYAKCLRIQAQALLDGSYEKAAIRWMKLRPARKIDLVIGPIERYDDKLLFVKTSYQAWVGVMDERQTESVNRFRDIILSSRRKILMPSEKVDYYDKVQTRVDDLLLFSGLIAKTMFVGVNLPNDPSLMEKYGSEITIFKQVNQHRFMNEILPAFNRIFADEFKKSFSLNDLEEGSLYLVLMHELAHTYLRYRHSERNLQDLFPVIDELAAYVMGMKVCGSLLLKDVMTTKQLESIMVAFISRSLHLALQEKDNKSTLHYMIGGAMFINYLLESGALKEMNGLSWPNFTKMFVSLEQLSSILERLLSQGTRKDAEMLIKKYGSIATLQRFR